MRKKDQELNKQLGEHLPTSVQCSSPASPVFTGHYGEMLSCNRALSYKHQSMPQSDRDVNYVNYSRCTNGESSVFHYNGKCFRFYQRITAKPPSCLQVLREPLKHFTIPMYFHCLTSGKWRKCGRLPLYSAQSLGVDGSHHRWKKERLQKDESSAFEFASLWPRLRCKISRSSRVMGISGF